MQTGNIMAGERTLDQSLRGEETGQETTTRKTEVLLVMNGVKKAALADGKIIM